MSPHQSSQSRSPTPKNSSVLTTNHISWRNKTNAETSEGTCHVSSPSAISAASLLAAGDILDYDMSPLNNHTNTNPLSYYEIKTKQCNGGGSGELDGSCKNNNVDMHFWTYPNFSQTYSSHNRLWNTGSSEKRYSGSKNSQLHGIPFYYGVGGRGYGRPICWNRRKVYFAMYL